VPPSDCRLHDNAQVNEVVTLSAGSHGPCRWACRLTKPRRPPVVGASENAVCESARAAPRGRAAAAHLITETTVTGMDWAYAMPFYPVRVISVIAQRLSNVTSAAACRVQRRSWSNDTLLIL
jgi:hypothetical protein